MWPRYVWDVPSVGRIRLSAVKSVCQIKQWDKTRYPSVFPTSPRPYVCVWVSLQSWCKSKTLSHLVHDQTKQILPTQEM